MASSTAPHALNAQGKRTSFGGIPGNNAAHLLERSRAGLRGGTPDSEALASSDDEQDQLHQRLQKVTSNPATKPPRRASWLTEGQQASSRTASIAAPGPFSPVSPGIHGPPTEHAAWGSAIGSNSSNSTVRGPSGATAFPWTSTIWNTDSSKGPPQRLTEVVPSPTTLVPPGSATLFSDDKMASPRDTTAEQAIPFAIPLQPTPKTYRSQSYSVGQLDPETTKPPPTNIGMSGAYARPRVGTSYAGLQHRPSRPSMLGDLSHDTQQLGQLREVDDDEDDAELSDPTSDQARKIEQLTRENAMLRQAAAENRERANTSQFNPTSPIHHHMHHPDSARDTVSSEGSGSAIYDEDDKESRQRYRPDASGRRFSEYGVKSGTHQTLGGYNDHRSIEGAKRSQWQSSLGFGGVVEPPQSRRHSFAEPPTRQNSTGNGTDTQRVHDPMDYGSPTSGKAVQADALTGAMARQNDDVNYFARTDPNLRGLTDQRSPSSGAMHQAYMHGQYGQHPHFGGPHQRPKQLLYIVTFKCQRADVFYIQEGTGLQVNQGDLVIVEADRGTDLGTVASGSVPWAEAKAMKDKLLVEHHRWLMMFSPHAQQGGVLGQNPNGPQQNNGASGGSGQIGSHDVPTGELKPKLIKRLAAQHEINALREKEGAEAKAKRTCQQKVVEHRLKMEILDAEFQMDWKKLTFFYFADAYINFNPLVTDLFKIYKTRIWMSAINTAAIAAPIGNHHLQGGPHHRHYSPELEEYSARHAHRRPQESPAVGTVPVQYPPGEAMWNPAQDFGALGPTAVPQMYGQPDYDLRQVSPMPHLGPYVPATAAMPPYYEYNGGMNQKPMPYPRTERIATPRSHGDQGGDWDRGFQNLSLGR